MKYFKFLFLFINSFLFLFPHFITAQTLINIPYSCGFEDSVEVSKWTLNAGAQGALCTEQWLVSNAARSEGRNGLYISNDGFSAKYGKAANIVVAYREFSVPVSAPNYDISFDWKNSGAAGVSDLYVYFLPNGMQAPNSNAVSGSPTSIPATYSSFRRAVLNNKTQWQNYAFQANLATGNTYKLVFVWVNSNTDTTLMNPVGACIDNVQIAMSYCRKPDKFNVTLTCDTSWLSWQGTSQYYEIEYKSKKNLRWRKLGIFSTDSTYLTNMPEGMYDFRIRGICPTDSTARDTSAYLTRNSILLYCPENHCVDYANLYSSQVSGFYGSFTNPTQYQGIVDFGADDVNSRHTAVWTPDEYDPRTKNRLKTIPDNAIASVRLGNWKAGTQAEKLTYTFIVDSAQSIILLQYAIVLQDPNHDPSEQPHFDLRIYDQNNNLIDPDCGVAEFYAGQNDVNWKNGVSGVLWKDWTTVGLNLSPYAGQTLTISLETKDCSLSAHYGYAYFTLDCASATIKTNTCGDSPYIQIDAPDGFNYEWTNPEMP
ncbi:MAG: fibronectin type III domain-containing protein, partial [Paludibacter sp.]|nr:fibronectin type III domain-containing protein [Paludibacter sp.]